MAPSDIPPILAPKLLILRGNVLLRATVDQVLSTSPALERVDCNHVLDVLPFKPTGHASLPATRIPPTMPTARRVRVVERSAPIAGPQPAYNRQSYAWLSEWLCFGP